MKLQAAAKMITDKPSVLKNASAPENIPVKRERKVRRSVVIADKIADKVITVGGIMVIVAVVGMLLFLFAEVLPLFKKGKVTATYEYSLKEPLGKIVNTGIDEYKTLAFVLSQNGVFRLFHARTGRALTSGRVDLGGREITSFRCTIDGKHMVFGFSDGTVSFADADFTTSIIPGNRLPEKLIKIDELDKTDNSAVYSEIPGSQYRKVSFAINLKDTVKASPSGRPVIAVDYNISGEAERLLTTFIAVDSDGVAILSKMKSRINLLTGKKKTMVKTIRLPSLPDDISVHSVLLTEKADMVFIASDNGRVYRFDTHDFNSPALAEIFPLLPDGVKLSFMDFLTGGQSIIAAGDDSSLNVYFIINNEKRGTLDKKAITPARSFDIAKFNAEFFRPSGRGKSFAVALNNGGVKIFHATSEKTLFEFVPDTSGVSLIGIALTPRMDGIITIQNNGLVLFREFEVPHPEITFKTLFQKVWYEGYPEPDFTWQSSAGTDDYESKFSLIPLIFGTVKAAVYSLLFALPVAILAAVYTSEFLSIKMRNTVKPLIEMMASLPSVILGFVAALVLAPVVETWIMAILISFLFVPFFLMAGSYLWQLLPVYLSMRWEGAPKIFLMFVALMSAIFLSVLTGAWFEDFFFHGSLKAWLNGGAGGPEPFLFLLLLPLSFLIMSFLVSRYFGAVLNKGPANFNRSLMEIIRWLITLIASVCFAGIAAKLLAFSGFEARGSFVGTYVQRNTFIVSFAMGFAVVPIIYTIAEDALNSVPDHLRAASLGCGATKWQTTIYVVLPAAISGIFSAVMIGLGRAVGETMIVVMAAGNTPLMDINIFNGLRALSATIAVELPEAVKDGTLYRVLFLSALVLFAMTFIINTVAEIVRLRFRKRTAQL